METNDLVTLKVPELKAKCKQLGISHYSKLPKLQLIEILKTHASSLNSKPFLQGDHMRCGLGSALHGNPSRTSVHLTLVQQTPLQLQKSTGSQQKPDAFGKVNYDEMAACHPVVEGKHVEQSTLEYEATRVSRTAAGQLTSSKRVINKAVKRHAIDPLARAYMRLDAISPRAYSQIEFSKASQARNSGNDASNERLSVKEYNNALMHPRLDTTASRVQYAEEHLLNRLLQNLNASRTHPIVSPPFPRPLPYDTGPHDPTLGLAFQGIHPDLYKNLQDPAFLVCFRFWTCRLYISFQLGSGEAWSSDAREMGLLGPDISEQFTWIRRGTEKKFIDMGSFYGARRNGLETPLQECNIRSDWQHFIEGDGPDTMPFVIKTKDDLSFPEGVSNIGEPRIACRAALASCDVSSFSGSKLSAVQMDADWLGRPLDQREIQGTNKVELYLPEALQILSVHLPDPPFHPALAIVQRSMGHADIVLIETGQVVGNEDVGVTALWQGILACDEKGGSWPENDRSDFWQGWESRILDGEL